MSFKNVVIVGNAKTVLHQENGDKIDTFDYVVRMGDMPRIKGYEKYVGTRTDMYRLKWFNMFYTEKNIDVKMHGLCRETFEFDFKDILYIFQDCDEYSDITPITRRYYNISLNRSFLCPIGNRYVHDLCQEKFKLEQKNAFYFNSHDYETLICELLRGYSYNLHEKWIDPSGGLCTIWFFLKNFPSINIYVTGFDCFKTCHYWKPDMHTSFDSHNSVLEQLMYKRLVKKGYISEL